ncbi:chloride channel protein [Heterostelium album PN500]|uniref:Chloride channel protein n=1 Tax=Heterostelium pallidum (strain ATCC 26659 / Pp 5 / PN500) TaxID=670386 RepID=D3BCQ0_HETP5|nr:chloride channel protein [Heterostelium album PN500]EFA80692.1 chloride channel protein [Heterostelium album PN500]|eukprot:XP_020432812.1 chloride channel protein [Heterostelium album PN500]
MPTLKSVASDADLFNLVMPKADTVGFKSKQGGISKQAIKWAKFTRLNNFYIWLFLAVVGLLASISLVTIDLTFKFVVFKGRSAFIGITDFYIVQYLSFILWTVVLAVGSALVCVRLCPAAIGSGVPDLKSIFSGFWNAKVVQPAVGLFKVFGLLLSYGSGMSIGKEGPYIHISAILANALLGIKPFKNIAPNETQRSQMLASCSALGVAATFGSPIGGVLFSIEVTGTYYLISNYWRAFFASTVGAVGIKILLSKSTNDLLESYRTDFSSLDLATVQLLALIITGILCGLLGSLFIFMYQKIYSWKKHNKDLMNKITPYGEVIFVALVTGILDHASAVKTMFTAHDQVNAEDLKIWTESLPFSNSIIFACFLYIVVKLVLTAVSITLPIPYGIYIPLFAIGAAVGRFVGEIMKLIFPNMKDLYPTGYAVVGAAALCGGATRTVSSAVIILELTNDLTYMVPVLIGVVLACGIGNLLNHSIYDCFLRNKQLPYLPFIRVKSDSTTAIDIINKAGRTLHFITHKTTLAQISSVLDNSMDASIPVVEGQDNMHLIGTISRTTLEEVVSYHERLHSYSMNKSPLNNASGDTILTINHHHASDDDRDGDRDGEADEDYSSEKSLLNDNEMKVFSSSSYPSTTTDNYPISNNDDDSNRISYVSSSNNSNDDNNNNIIHSESSEQLQQQNDSNYIDLVQMELQNPWVVIDSSPFSVVESTPVRKIVFMFMMLGGNVLYVLKKGKLVGVISKSDIADIGAHNK